MVLSLSEHEVHAPTSFNMLLDEWFIIDYSDEASRFILRSFNHRIHAVPIPLASTCPDTLTVIFESIL